MCVRLALGSGLLVLPGALWMLADDPPGADMPPADVPRERIARAAERPQVPSQAVTEIVLGQHLLFADRIRVYEDVAALAGLARPHCDETPYFLEEVRSPEQLHCLAELGWALQRVPCRCLLAYAEAASGTMYLICDGFLGESVAYSHEAEWTLAAQCSLTGRLTVRYGCESDGEFRNPATDPDAVFQLREAVEIACPAPTAL